MRHAKVENERIVEIFDDKYTTIPDGCEPLTPECEKAIKEHPLGFSVFKKRGANVEIGLDLVAEVEADLNDGADPAGRGADRDKVALLEEQVQILTERLRNMERQLPRGQQS